MADQPVLNLTQKVPEAGDFVYLVSNNNDFKADVDDLGIGAIEDTYSNLVTAQNNSNLQPGRLYYISDKEIYINALTDSEFKSKATLRAINADYQNIDQWISDSDGGTYSAGDNAIYNNLVFENDTGTNTDTAPPNDSTNWTEISFSDNSSLYNVEFDAIFYDFVNDTISYREDKRGNKIGAGGLFLSNSDPINDFQWGNDSVTNNYLFEGVISDCLNQRGTIKSNIITGGGQIIATDNSSNIQNNTVSGAGTIDAPQNEGNVNRNTVIGFGTLEVKNNTGSKTNFVVEQDSTFTSNGTGSGMEYNTISERSQVTVPTNASSFSNNKVGAEASTTITNNQNLNRATILGIQFDFTVDSFITASTQITRLEKNVNGSIDISKSIQDFPAQDEVVVSGDKTNLYESSNTIQVSGSTSNDGSYTVSSTAYDSNADETTITISTTSFTVEAGAGTVTGEIIDLNTKNHFGRIQVLTDVDFSIKKIKNYTESNELRLLVEGGHTMTVVNEGNLNNADTINTESGSNLTLTGGANPNTADFVNLLYTGTSFRESYSSILP